MVRDRAFLGLLFVVGGSSLLWGLYEIFYVSPTAPAGIFNTVLGLMVLLVTWAFLVPYVVPSSHGDPTPGTAPVYRPYLAKPIAPAELPVQRPVAPRVPAPSPRPVAIAGSPPIARPVPRPIPASRPTATPVVSAPAAISRPPSAPASPPPPLSVPTSPFSASPSQAPAANPPMADREVEEILADLPESMDADLAAENADEVIRRLDALLRDLAGDDEKAPSVPPV
jgi:hypothetical protein